MRILRDYEGLYWGCVRNMSRNTHMVYFMITHLRVHPRALSLNQLILGLAAFAHRLLHAFLFAVIQGPSTAGSHLTKSGLGSVPMRLYPSCCLLSLTYQVRHTQLHVTDLKMIRVGSLTSEYADRLGQASEFNRFRDFGFQLGLWDANSTNTTVSTIALCRRDLEILDGIRQITSLSLSLSLSLPPGRRHILLHSSRSPPKANNAAARCWSGQHMLF